jgi:S1-C subfamily serine protease
MLNDPVVRIYDTSVRVVGSGFLVDDNYVITCAHVINLALRKYDLSLPTEYVTLDFPLSEHKATYKAKVIVWQAQENFDLAGLEIHNYTADNQASAFCC